MAKETHETHSIGRGENAALGEETRHVMRARGKNGKDWSLASAEIFTGINRATIYNMKRGLSVRPASAIQFARAVAPKGQEELVEKRWLEIVTVGKTDLPLVDYTYRPELHEARDRHAGEPAPDSAPRMVDDPRMVQALNYLEKLPTDLFDTFFNNLRITANYAVCANKKHKDDLPAQPVAA